MQCPYVQKFRHHIVQFRLQSGAVKLDEQFAFFALLPFIKADLLDPAGNFRGNNYRESAYVLSRYLGREAHAFRLEI